LSVVGRYCLIITTLALTNPAAQAAPLGYIILEGRKQGTTDWSRHLFAAPGDVIEYRLLADLAPVGSSNVQGTDLQVINSTANSGFNSLSLQIRQDASAPIKVSFNPPLATPDSLASFRNGWADGTGASPGALTPRSDGTGNDLTGIRPVHAAGVFSGVDPEVILTGSTFTVTQQPPGTGTVLTPSWGTGSGSLRINGAGQVFMTPFSESSADPRIGFQPLTLGIPEPATFVLAALGAAAGVIMARRGRAK
jgi:hypothetical protein